MTSGCKSCRSYSESNLSTVEKHQDAGHLSRLCTCSNVQLHDLHPWKSCRKMTTFCKKYFQRESSNSCELWELLNFQPHCWPLSWVGSFGSFAHSSFSSLSVPSSRAPKVTQPQPPSVASKRQGINTAPGTIRSTWCFADFHLNLRRQKTSKISKIW